MSPSTVVTVPSKASGALASSSTLNMMHIAVEVFASRGQLQRGLRGHRFGSHQW